MLAALLFAPLAHAVHRSASESSGLDFDGDHMRKDGRKSFVEGSDYMSSPGRSAEVELGFAPQPFEESKAADGFSFTDSFASAFSEVSGSSGAQLIDNPDHWNFCAKQGEMCQCQGGEVRFGRKTTEQEVWTTPILLGSDTGVLCHLDHLQNKRVHVPSTGMSDEPYQCQCIERVVRISTEVMSFLQIGERVTDGISLLEEGEEEDDDDDVPTRGRRRDDDEEASYLEEELMDEGIDVPASATSAADRFGDDLLQEHVSKNTAQKPTGSGPWKMCLYVPVEDFAAEAARDEKITQEEEAAVKGTERMLNLELATTVYMKECKDDDQEVWTFLMSSGQIRHAATGKCLAVHLEGGEPKLKGNDCILVESPDQSQRWHVHFYTGKDFAEGQGQIKLAIGLDSGDPFCLTTTSWDTPALARCKKSSATWTFKSPREVGSHGWSYCANEGQGDCGCNGEIKFGNKDMEAWTHAVPVPNELDQVSDVRCSLEELRDIAIHDPVLIPPQEDPMYRECQCKMPFGHGASHYAGEGFVSSAEAVGEQSNTVMYVGVGAGVAILALIGYILHQKKQKDALLYGFEEYEDEEEYEEDEEEYYDEDDE
jgi:hypothetical protein